MMNSVYGLMALVMTATATPTEDRTVESTVLVHTDSPVYVTGDLLLKFCSADEKATNGPEICDNYIAGVIDTIVSNRDTIQGYQICWPKEMPASFELRAMTVKYLRVHPEFSTGIGASVVNTMLFDAYRCPGSVPPSDDKFPHKN
jgi:Rap1a immunity proteins